MFLRQEAEAQQQAAQQLTDVLHWLEGQFDGLGPYFMGNELSLVDISLLPFFLRVPVLQHYRGFSLPAVCPIDGKIDCSISFLSACTTWRHPFKMC